MSVLGNALRCGNGTGQENPLPSAGQAATSIINYTAVLFQVALHGLFIATLVFPSAGRKVPSCKRPCLPGPPPPPLPAFWPALTGEWHPVCPPTLASCWAGLLASSVALILGGRHKAKGLDSSCASVSLFGFMLMAMLFVIPPKIK